MKNKIKILKKEMIKCLDNKNKIIKKKFDNFKKKYSKYLEELYKKLEYKSDKELKYIILNEITEKPKCKFCNNKVIFYKQYNKFNNICYNKECSIMKQKEIKKQKYGNENYNNMTKNKKYGNDNYNNPEKSKQTRIEKYSYYYVNGEKANLSKLKNNSFECFFKWNEYILPNNEVIKIQGYKNLALDYIIKNITKNVSKSNSIINYTINNKQHNYFPDLEFDNKIIEVKSSYTLLKQKDMNINKFKSVFIYSQKYNKEFEIWVIKEKPFDLIIIKNMEELFKEFIKYNEYITLYDLKYIFKDEKEYNIMKHFIKRNLKCKERKDTIFYKNNQRFYKKNICHYKVLDIVKLCYNKLLNHKTGKQLVNKIFSNFILFFKLKEIKEFQNIPKPKYFRKIWRIWYFLEQLEKRSNIKYFKNYRVLLGNYLKYKETKSKKLKDFKNNNTLKKLLELDKYFSNIKNLDDFNLFYLEKDNIIKILNNIN